MKLVIGDIHGELEQLKRLLPIIRDAEQAIFVGDYLDRGPDSRGVIELVGSLDNAVLLEGNHERMAISDDPYWGINGGHATMDNWGDDFGSFMADFSPFYKKLKLYHKVETPETTYYISHAGANPLYPIDYQFPPKGREGVDTLLWERSHIRLLPNISPAWEQDTVICGHTPIGDYPLFFDRLIALDTGCGKGGKLSAVVIPERAGETPKVYQS